MANENNEELDGIIGDLADQLIGGIQEPQEPVVDESNPQPSVEDVISKAITPQVEDSAQVIGIPSPVQEPDKGDPTLVGASRLLSRNPFLEDSPNGTIEKVTAHSGYSDLILPSGKVSGISQFVAERVYEDYQMKRDRNINMDVDEQYGNYMVKLYGDTMAKLGKGVPGAIAKTKEHREYVQSSLGIQELEDALYSYNVIQSYGGKHGDIPDDIWENLPEFSGTGLRDPKLIGLDEAQYQSLGIPAKIGYNLFVGASETGRRLAQIVGFEPEERLDTSVAPVGEAAGFIGSFVVPFSAASRTIQGLKWGAKLKPWQVGVLSGAVADFAVTTREDGNLSTVLTENFPDNPAASNFVTEFLSLEDDDSVLEIKLKAAVEGGIIDRVFAGSLWGLRAGGRGSKKGLEWLGEEANKMAATVTNNLPTSKVGKARQVLTDLDVERTGILSDVSIDTTSALSKIPEGMENFASPQLAKDLLVKSGSSEELAGAILENIDQRTVNELVSRLLPQEDLLRVLQHEGKILDAQGDVLIAEIRKVLSQSGAVGGPTKTMKRHVNSLSFPELSLRIRAQQHKVASGFKATANEAKMFSFMRARFDRLKADFKNIDELVVQRDTLLKEATPDQSAVKLLDDKIAAARRSSASLRGELGEPSRAAVKEQEIIASELAFRGTLPARSAELSQVIEPFRIALREYNINKTDLNGAKLQASYYDLLKALNVGNDDRKVKLVINNIPTSPGKSAEEAIEYSRRMRANNYLSPSDIAANKQILNLQSDDILPVLRKDTKIQEIYDAAGGKKAFNKLPIEEKRKIAKEVEGFVPEDPEMVAKLESKVDERLRALDVDKGKVDLPVTRPVAKVATGVSSAAITNMLSSWTQLATSAVSGVFVKPLLATEKALGASLSRAYRNVFKDAASARVRSLRSQAKGSVRQAIEADRGKVNPVWPTLPETLDNLYHLWTGGAYTPGKAGIDPLQGEGVQKLDNLLARILSTPSRLDADQLARSESSLGNFSERGFDPSIGFSPDGLSRLGKDIQSIENPVKRAVASSLLAVMESIPRRGLGSIDEALKTSTYWNTFSDSLVEGLTQLEGAAKMSDDSILDVHERIMTTLLERTDEARNFDLLAKDLISDASIPEESQKIIMNILEAADTRANQMARTVTLTQDVPKSVEGIVRAIQTSELGRIPFPFARAATNAFNMGFERVPLLNMFNKETRLGLLGRLSQEERERAVGKTIVGGGLIGISSWLSNRDQDGIHLREVERGSWKQYVLYIPSEDKTVEDYLVRFYELNKNATDEIAEKSGFSDPIDYLRSVMPIEGSHVALDFERFSPLGMLLGMGVMINDAFKGQDPYDYEEDSPFYKRITDLTVDMTEFMVNQGLTEEFKGFADNLDNPEVFIDRYLVQRLGIGFSPLHGLRNSPGEALSPDDSPARYESMFEKMLNKVAPPLADVAKRRNAYGQAIVRDDRFFNFLGEKTTASIIEAEFNYLAINKRAPKVDAVPDYQGIDLTEFTLDKSLATPDQLEVIETIEDTVHAYEAWRVLVGVTGKGKFEGSIRETEKYLKSSDYTRAKAKLDEIIEEFPEMSPELKSIATVTLNESRDVLVSRINGFYDLGKSLASVQLRELSNIYVNSEGISLQEVQNGIMKNVKQGVRGVRNVLDKSESALDQLREGK